MPVIDVVVEDVLGGEVEGAVGALGPVALPGCQPLRVAVVGVGVVGGQGAEQGWAELKEKIG